MKQQLFAAKSLLIRGDVLVKPAISIATFKYLRFLTRSSPSEGEERNSG